MCKNIVERGMQQMTKWCMHISCWITKATHTHKHTHTQTNKQTHTKTHTHTLTLTIYTTRCFPL